MRKGIYKVTLEQMQEVMSMDEEAFKVARLSRDLFVGYQDDVLVSVMGLIPPTLLSDEAYIWLITTEALSDCKLIFGREARKFIRNILTQYVAVYGHCEFRSVRWLKHLGASVGPMDDGGLTLFRITR